MKAFKKILVPVDLSDNSQKIVPYVITMSNAFNAKIYLLFVAHVFKNHDTLFMPSMVISGFESDIIKNGKRRLENFSKKFYGDLCAYNTMVKTGEPGKEIIRMINSKNFDLIIIGTHGRKGLNHILFGSVAEYVVKMSPVPVMTINPYRAIEK